MPATPPPASGTLGLRPAEFSPRDMAFMGALDMAATVIAARFLALVGIVGAAFLTWNAEAEPNGYKLGLLGIYCAGVALTVYLASK